MNLTEKELLRSCVRIYSGHVAGGENQFFSFARLVADFCDMDIEFFNGLTGKWIKIRCPALDKHHIWSGFSLQCARFFSKDRSIIIGRMRNGEIVESEEILRMGKR
ncbi:MAG: hypothetical protein AAB766_04190 [Patescibacteria group bacterium]